MYPVYAARLDVRSRDASEALPAFRERLQGALDAWLDEALTACGLTRQEEPAGPLTTFVQQQVTDAAGRSVGALKRLQDATESEVPLSWAWSVRFEDDRADGAISRIAVQARIADGGMGACLTAEHTVAGDRFAQDGFVSPALDLVQRIVSVFDVHCGPTPVTAGRWSVGASQVPALVEAIRDPDRVMPLMVVTRNRAGQTLLDLQQVGPALLGVVRVAVLEDRFATWEFRERLGEQWNCYDGAVRIFSSPFTDTDPPDRHRLVHPAWFAVRLREGAPDRQARLVAELRATAAFLIREDPEVEAAIDWYERESIRQQLSAIADVVPGAPSPGPAPDQWEPLRDALNTLRDAQDEASRLRAEREDLKDELAKARLQVNKLRMQLESLTAGNALADDEPAAAENPFEPKPGPLHDVVVEARKRFDGPHMVILDCALDSARKVQVKDMADAWQKLAHLDDIARLWHDKALRTSLKAEFEKRGITYTDKVSNVTVGRNKSAYTVSFPPGSSNRVVLGPHIRLNLEDRVYWHQHENPRMFIIGHIGDHLPDSTT